MATFAHPQLTWIFFNVCTILPPKWSYHPQENWFIYSVTRRWIFQSFSINATPFLTTEGEPQLAASKLADTHKESLLDRHSLSASVLVAKPG